MAKKLEGATKAVRILKKLGLVEKKENPVSDFFRARYNWQKNGGEGEYPTPPPFYRFKLQKAQMKARHVY